MIKITKEVIRAKEQNEHEKLPFKKTFLKLENKNNYTLIQKITCAKEY